MFRNTPRNIKSLAFLNILISFCFPRKREKGGGTEREKNDKGSIDILCSTMRACHLKSNANIDRNKKVPAANQLTIGGQCLFLAYQPCN